LVSTKASAKVLTLASLGTRTASGTLHARKHGCHLAWVHLGGIHARSHHLLHHGLHLGRDPVHTRHTSSSTAATTAAAAAAASASTSSTLHAHTSHHHHVEVFHHLLVVDGKSVGAKLAANRFLFGSI
jgi:hypothetical protein